ncbi:MAG: DUF2723 domain-containing protein [Bacteroidota bacterium]
MDNIFRSTKFLLGLLLFLLSFGIYAITATRTVSFIDAGELATVASTLGIAHPTGYPFFTLLSHFVTKLPLGISTIFQLNLFAAFLCAAGIVFFFNFLFFFTTEFVSSNQRAIANEQSLMQFVPAFCGALLLAFSETYWSQAIAIEVYSLHTVFLSVLLLTFTKAIGNKPAEKEGLSENTSPNSGSIFFVFAFLLGLSFTNHLTTILLAPAFLYLFFSVYGFSKESMQKIYMMIIPFVLGLSVYLYLPLRSSQHPLYDWGHPATFERFFWHVRGKQFSVWFFSSLDVAKEQLKYFFSQLPSEFAYSGIFFALVGIISLRKHKRALIFSALLFLGCVLYSINYDIHDIDSYFLLAYVTVAIWSAFGIQFLLKKFEVKSKKNEVKQKKEAPNKKIIAIVIVVLLSLSPLLFHYENVDASDNYLVEDYTRNVFSSLDSSAIIISFQWDYFVSASYYFQSVENQRKDIVIVDKELLRRSWYFMQMERHHPWFIKNSRAAIDNFLIELDKFEHNIPYNPQTIERLYRELILSFIEKNIPSHPIYITPEIEGDYTRGYQRIPSGLVFRLIPEGAQPLAVKEKIFTFRQLVKKGRFEETIPLLYSNAYFEQARYLDQHGNRAAAIRLINEASRLTPDNEKIQNTKRWLMSQK